MTSLACKEMSIFCLKLSLESTEHWEEFPKLYSNSRAQGDRAKTMRWLLFGGNW